VPRSDAKPFAIDRDLEAVTILAGVPRWVGINGKTTNFASRGAPNKGRTPELHFAGSYAARTVFKNLSTSILRRLLSLDRDCAADSTWDDAEPVSPAPL
jgi:hypothetical protein